MPYLSNISVIFTQE